MQHQHHRHESVEPSGRGSHQCALALPDNSHVEASALQLASPAAVGVAAQLSPDAAACAFRDQFPGEVDVTATHTFHVEGLGRLDITGDMPQEREEPGQPLAAHDAALLAVCQQFYNTRARVFLLALKKIARAQIALDIAEADRIHIETVRWVKESDKAGNEWAATQRCNWYDLRAMAAQVVPDVAAAVLQQASAAEPLTYTWYNYTRPAATLPPLEGAAEDAVAGPGAAGTVQASGSDGLSSRIVSISGTAFDAARTRPPAKNGAVPGQPPPPTSEPPPPPLDLYLQRALELELREAVMDWYLREAGRRSWTVPQPEDLNGMLFPSASVNGELGSGASMTASVGLGVHAPALAPLFKAVLTQQTMREGRLLMQQAFQEFFMGGLDGQIHPLEVGFLNERQMKQCLADAYTMLVRQPEEFHHFTLRLHHKWTQSRTGDWDINQKALSEAGSNSSSGSDGGSGAGPGQVTVISGTSEELRALVQAVHFLLTDMTSAMRDCWVFSDSRIQLRALNPDPRSHPLTAASSKKSQYLLRETKADGSQVTFQLSGPQLLDLSEVLDLFMADHPDWLRRNLTAPPPEQQRPRRRLLGFAV